VVGWLDDCNDVPPLVLELELLLVLAGDEAVGILLLLLLVYCKNRKTIT
jgi:hypothetical protein